MGHVSLKHIPWVAWLIKHCASNTNGMIFHIFSNKGDSTILFEFELMDKYRQISDMQPFLYY